MPFGDETASLMGSRIAIFSQPTLELVTEYKMSPYILSLNG